jgi:predicted lipoprotein with Yx(FWY)xxD motif
MSRKPIALTLAAVAGATMPALIPAASGAHGASMTRPAAAGAKVQVRHTRRGNLLVNGRGFTLYTFARDSRGHDQCVRISGCRGIWVLDTTHGAPVAGPGVQRSLLGTIRVGSSTQVTYGGHPLYSYIADQSPAQTSYVGKTQFGGKWLGIRPSGAQVG